MPKKEKPSSRTTKIKWLANRLGAMSAQEVLTRGHHTIRNLTWRKRQNWFVPHPTVRMNDTWTMPPINADIEYESALLLKEADAYIAGRYTLLNISFEQEEPDWHLDVETQTRSPVNFSPDIDYRDPEVAGNVKNIWEINRHRQLTILAAAYALTSDERYSLCIEHQLCSWIEHNPFLKGVNWHSALELGVRLIAWVWVERLLRGSAVHDRLFGTAGAMWPAIYQHQWLISKSKSVGSSANNHLVGELAGLYIASTIWPYYSASKLWQRESMAALEREIRLQTFGSGLNREQAFSYHRFSLELFLLVAIEAQRTPSPASRAYLNTLKQMIEVIPELVDTGGNIPSYGDEDGAIALQLQPRDACLFNWLYHLGAGLVQARVPISENPSGSLAATLIALQPGETKADTHYTPSPHSKAFKDAGVYVLTANRGTPSEIFCLADAGNLGFLSIAAHGHADALSFTLSVGGQSVIVDPGTYKYFGDVHWRKYFRSTRAHNTIVVDGMDQSEQGGAFLWGRKANCSVLQWVPTPERVTLEAEHDGYTHLRGNVMHRRKLTLSAEAMHIVDTLTGHGDHEIEWCLHFGPDCDVDLDDHLCGIAWERGAMDIDLSPEMEWRVERGTDNAGWYSSGVNVKVPVTTLIGCAKATLPQMIANTINFNL